MILLEEDAAPRMTSQLRNCNHRLLICQHPLPLIASHTSLDMAIPSGRAAPGYASLPSLCDHALCIPIASV